MPTNLPGQASKPRNGDPISLKFLNHLVDEENMNDKQTLIWEVLYAQQQSQTDSLADT